MKEMQSIFRGMNGGLLNMNRRIKFLSAVLLACLLVLTFSAGVAQAKNDQNLLENGNIESFDAEDQLSAWYPDVWDTDEELSKLVVEVSDYDDGFCLSVENIGANDARYQQDVLVEPDSMYRFSAMVKAAGCDPDEAGAGLSIAYSQATSDYLYDTNGAWVLLEVYGQTGGDQTEMSVMARVGGYSSLNTGKAWFDDLRLEKVDSLPEGAVLNDFSTIAPATPEVDEDRTVDYTAHFMLIALLFAVLVTMFAMRTNAGKVKLGNSHNQVRNILLLCFAFALLIRMGIAMSVRGYPNDMSCFEGWAERMYETGPIGFYSDGYFCDYPPGYMLVLWILGGLRNFFGLPFSIAYDSPLHWLLIKSVPIACDLAVAWIIYNVSRRSLGETSAGMLALFFAFNPAAIVNSAAWGQIDSVLTLLLLLTAIQLVRKQWKIALPLYVLAVLIKPQALMFGPLGLIVLIASFVWEKDKIALLKNVLIGCAASIGLALAVIVPFSMHQPWHWLIDKYKETLNSYPHLVLNACNLYTLLDMNWVDLAETPLGLKIFSWASYVLSFGYAAFLYFKGKRQGTEPFHLKGKSQDHKKLFLICAMLLVMLFAFGAKMHERYVFPAIAMLLVAYAICRDARVLLAALLLSLTQFLNAALVLQSRHLQNSQQVINAIVSLLNVLLAGGLAWVSWDVCIKGRIYTLDDLGFGDSTSPVSDKNIAAATLFSPPNHKLKLTRWDVLIVAGLTLVYSFIAFYNLGTTSAPQTSWTSTAPGEEITFDLGEKREFTMAYFGGIADSTFSVEFSDDGQNWSEPHLALYRQGEIFRWLWYEPHTWDEEADKLVRYYEPYTDENGDDSLRGLPGNNDAQSDLKEPTLYDDYIQKARFVRFIAQEGGLVLNEVVFLDKEGKPYPIASVQSSGGDPSIKNDPIKLIDEQQTVPVHPSYLNSTYFDEIYHPRSAYEHLNGIYPIYEWTHPPLGKVIMSIGIALFGMSPFGWRFMGTVMGILMVPAMYLTVKQLLKRTDLAFIGTFLMAFDSMHFAQTRLATIDSYSVFFIMMMYLFMFRYCQMSFYKQNLRKTLVPLALSGLFMGLGCATKWIGIYAAAGLALLFFYTLYRRFAEYRFAKENAQTFEGSERVIAERAVRTFWKNTGITIVWCILFFVIVPLVIYYFSYSWSFDPDEGLSISGVIDEQMRIFRYHSGLSARHPYESHWYQWLINKRPMFLYDGSEYFDGMVSYIYTMGNPAVWWVGLAAMIFAISRLFINDGERDRRYVLVAIGYLSQLVPWMFVSRSIFIYHYFASVPFMIVGIVLLLDWIRKKNVQAFKVTAIVYLCIVLGFFILFYPLVSGMPVPVDYIGLKLFRLIS